METAMPAAHRVPWKKGRLGQKVPFKPKDIWALRVRLQMETECESTRCAILNQQQAARMRSLGS